MARTAFTATKLRLMLTISMLVIVALAWAAIHFMNESVLKPYATTVSHASADAQASQDNLQTLQRIEKELNTYASTMDKAKSIVADSQSYQYQDQIIKDLTDYATRAGISVTNMDFTSGTSATTTPNATAQPNTAAPAGVKSTSVSVTVSNPVAYDKLLRFIKSVEQNLTKMQISRVGLAKGTNKDISSEVFVIEVYIR